MGRSVQVTAFPNHCQLVDTSGGDHIFPQPRTVKCTVAGNIAVDTAGGESNVVIPALAGETLQVQVVRVRQTGTTATGLTSFWV